MMRTSVEIRIGKNTHLSIITEVMVIGLEKLDQAFRIWQIMVLLAKLSWEVSIW
ncbi:MAG: hypothetical protein RLZZ338_3217 [Cyanobacteriota bacterium]|jgi:hypothetical protein